MIFEGSGSGQPITVFSSPTDTTLTTVYTQPSYSSGKLYSINIAAVLGGDATVIINDGSTDYKILSARTMTIDDRYFMEWRHGFTLHAGNIIKVQGTVNDSLTFAMEIVDVMRGPEHLS